MATNVNTNTALIQVDVQTTTKTVTLPSAAANTGRLLTVKDKFGNAAVNNITISPLPGDTIDGSASSYTLSNSGAAISLVSDGVSRWMTLNSPSQPFTGSTISLSSGTVVVSTLGLIDPFYNSISNVQVSSGKFLVGGVEIGTGGGGGGPTALVSTIDLFFGTGVGTTLTVNTLNASIGNISTLLSSNIQAESISASTVTGASFIGDGSRLSNIVLPSSTVITPQYAFFTVLPGSEYISEPWGSQLMRLSTIATQLSPISLQSNNIVLQVSTVNPQTYRVSYMTGGNQDTLTTPRPTITMAVSTPTSVSYYPSVENFEGGGGSVSFLERFDSNSQILFYMRGLSNYTFTDADANLYRMTFETVAGTSTDIFSTINVWTNYNRFVSTVDFDNTVRFNGQTIFSSISASNLSVSESILTSNLSVSGSILAYNSITTSASSIANSMYTNYLRVMCNAIIGPSSIIMGNDSITTLNIQASTLSLLDQSTMTYKAFFISSGSIYYGSNLASSGGSGSNVVASGGSTLSSLFVGSSSNQNFIKFWGSIGEYNNTVISQQSTGGGSDELLFFQGSSINDQFRFQTTGSVRFETGVSQPRNFLNANQVATPSMIINSSSNVGILTGAPTHTLDVAGTGRFQTLMSTTNIYTGSLFVGLYFA